MAIVVTYSGSVPDNAGDFSTSVDCNGGDILICMMARTGGSINSFTYNGTSLSLLDSFTPSANQILSFYYLTNPDSGTNTLAMDLSNNAPRFTYVFAFTGINLSNIVADSESGTGKSRSVTQANGTPAFGMYMGCNVPPPNNNAIWSSSGSETELLATQFFGGNGLGMFSNSLAGDGTLTINPSANVGSSFASFMILLNGAASSGPANVKTFDGIAQSTDIKTYLDVTLANTKSVNGIT